MEIYPDITVETEEIESNFIQAEARQGQISAIQVDWNKQVASAAQAASKINPFEKDLPAGVVVPTVDAVDWAKGRMNCDIRPRLFDKAADKYRLVYFPV